MRVIVPLAGKDERFEKAGAVKYLTMVRGEPLIKQCTESLPFFHEPHQLVFVVLKEHVEKYGADEKLRELYQESGGVEVVVLGAVTEGAACTVLAAKKHVSDDEPLVVYLADIIFDADMKRAIRNIPADGLIPTFPSSNAKYSYARLADPSDKKSRVVEVAEKRVIAENASAGFYFFRKGEDFVAAAEAMIRENRRVNGQFYVCPVYQKLIEMGKIVKIVPSTFRSGLGSPEEVARFCGDGA